MIKKHFYHDIIDLSSLLAELDKMELTHDEKTHLFQLANANIHHAILDLVLSELSDTDKKIFLIHLAQEKHDKIWKLLNTRIDNIEEKIKKAGEELKKELYKDIEETRLLSDKK